MPEILRVYDLELFPDPRVVDALRGKISKPIRTRSSKPGEEGKQVEVCLAEEGAGHFGLTDLKDNKEWSEIFNHVLLTSRYSVYFAQRMAQAGYMVNPQRILNGIIVSHAGRRQWDEAGWYPEAVKNAKEKRAISSETLGIQIIQDKVPQDALELVIALGHNVKGFLVNPSIYNSWDFKLSIYVDHKTSQQYEPLHKRMGDFLLGNFFKRGEITPELKERVYTTLKNIIERQKNYHLAREQAKPVSLEQADRIVELLGASPNSERLTRRELMSLILEDAKTETALIKAGINPDNINDETVPMPKWEDNLRRQYVQAAAKSIIEKMFLIGEKLDEAFPKNAWWGQYARRILEER